MDLSVAFTRLFAIEIFFFGGLFFFFADFFSVIEIVNVPMFLRENV